MSAELPWCYEHGRSVDEAGRCGWDKDVEAYLDRPAPTRAELLEERMIVERRIWLSSLRLIQIRQRLDELARREAA